MKKRSIILSIVLSVVTLGIYTIYWVYKLTNEVHEVLRRKNTASGGTVILYSIITFGIYGIYWIYKMGDGISEALSSRGMKTNGNEGILYLIVSLLGFSIIAVCLLQDKLNDIVDAGKN